MKDNIDFLGLEMRILIPSIRDFGKFVDRDYQDESFPVNRVSVAEDTLYFEQLRSCGVFDRHKDPRIGASFGISTCYGMGGSGGVIFLPKAELVFAKQKVPFIVNGYVTGAEAESSAREVASCQRINSHPEAQQIISPDNARYYIHINSPAMPEKQIREEYGRLCPILKED